MSNNNFSANNNTLNPFNSIKTNPISNTNQQNINPSFLSTNNKNLFGSKNFGIESNTINNPFSSNINPQQNSKKEENKDSETNKPNPSASSNPNTNNLFNPNLGNALYNNTNQGIISNSFPPLQSNNSLLQNKDNNQGLFGKQISFSAPSDAQPTNLFGNQPDNNTANIFGNANNFTKNVNNQDKVDNKESAQTQNKLGDMRNNFNLSSAQNKDNKNEANPTSIEQNFNSNKNIFGSKYINNNIDSFPNPENKIVSNNLFLQPKPTNRESDKSQTSFFTSVDKKIQNQDNTFKTSKNTEKLNENNTNNQNLKSLDINPSKNLSNKMNQDCKNLLLNSGIFRFYKFLFY